MGAQSRFLRTGRPGEKQIEGSGSPAGAVSGDLGAGSAARPGTTEGSGRATRTETYETGPCGLQ